MSHQAGLPDDLPRDPGGRTLRLRSAIAGGVGLLLTFIGM